MSNTLRSPKPQELPLTESQIIYLWLTSKKSSLTQNQYQRYLTQFQEAIYPLPLKQVTGKVIEIYFQSLVKTGRFKPASLNLRLAAIKSFYRYLLKSELISYNPTDTVILDNIKENKVQKDLSNIRAKSLDQSQINHLLAQLAGLDKLIVATLYYTGVRVSELIQIQNSDFRLKEGRWCLTIRGKGAKIREIKVPEKLLAIYQKLAAFRGKVYLIETKDYWGNPKNYARCSINSRLKKMAQKLGINDKLSPHWFRHSHASNALKNGSNLREIQLQLGHSSLNTTEQYLKANELGCSGDYL